MNPKTKHPVLTTVALGLMVSGMGIFVLSVVLGASPGSPPNDIQWIAIVVFLLGFVLLGYTFDILHPWKEFTAAAAIDAARLRPEESAPTVLCSNCGTLNYAGAVWCVKCQAKLP
jgi:hypothetical protein